MSFFKEMWQRMTTADTPTFFKKIRAFGLKLTVLSGALIVIPGVPATIATVAGFLATAGAVMSAVGQMACTDAPITKP